MSLAPEDWKRVESLLPEVLALPPDQREAFLRRECEAQPTVRAEIESLLAADDSTNGFLARPVALTTSESDEAGQLPAGSLLGAWRVLEPVGRGGMGEVYAAERADGRYRGRAAIKLLHAYLASPATRQRFAREGQLLGRLSHPHIARLLDAGTAADGRPYLVLEYVDGQRLDRWCDVKGLDVPARIGLFLQVCEAVAHAHAHLIVHRDLKPSNIFVDGNDAVKLLDFGIAKLIEDEHVAGATELTRLGGRPLTPAYAAPEQIRGEPVTTATDVYALGVLLYELLCGRSPYGVRTTTTAQIERAVLHDDPVPPSRTALTDEQAQARGAAPSALRRQLSGDLDAIIGKALGKLPAERYTTALAFADDLRRHLRSEPIAAQTHSFAYRARKFVRRHTVGVAAGTAIVSAVAVGVASTLWQADAARQQARIAETNAVRAERVKDFVVSLFREQNPLLRGSARARSPQELLAHAAERLDDELAQEPQLRAELLGELGVIQIDLGELAGAESLLQRAVKERTALYGADSPPVAQSLTALARIQLSTTRYSEAESLARRALDILSVHAVDPIDLTETQRILAAAISYGKGAPPEAEALLKEVVRIREQALGRDAPETIRALDDLSQLYTQGRRLEDAETAVRDLAERCRRRYGESSAALAMALTQLGDVLAAANRPEEAVATYRQGTAMLRQHAGEGALHLPGGLSRLAVQLRKLRRFEEALAVYQEAEPLLGEGQEGARGDLLRGRGRVLLLLNRADEGERDLRAAYEALRARAGEGNGLTWYYASEWGRGLAAQGHFVQAEAVQREALTRLGEIMGPEAYQNALLLTALAETLQQQPQKLEEAVSLYRRALQIAAAQFTERHLSWAGYAGQLADALERIGSPEALAQSVGLRERSLSIHREQLGEQHAETLQAADALAQSLRRLNGEGVAQTADRRFKASGAE